MKAKAESAQFILFLQDLCKKKNVGVLFSYRSMWKSPTFYRGMILQFAANRHAHAFLLSRFTCVLRLFFCPIERFKTIISSPTFEKPKLHVSKCDYI